MSNSDQQPILIDALNDADVYPHSVTCVQLIETHISWVFLTGDYVYKIKKPVNFGFLDFSTLEKRKRFCEQELYLNRRFAPDIYLDVVTITGSDSHPEIDGDGDIIEYAVKMREFPQTSLFTQCIVRGEITNAVIDNLAYKLASFHQQAISLESLPDDTLNVGSFKIVAQDAKENFNQTRNLLDYSPESPLENLRQWTNQQLDLLASAFTYRRADGFIRECHGDLHLGNIAVINGEVTFFDCIEFNERFRWVDTISELAFVLMDLDDKQHTDWANRVLNKYLEYTGDYQGLQLLLFYKIYRSMVRVKVSALRLEQKGLSSKQREGIKTDCRSYIKLATQYTVKKQPFLAITHGLSGSGKTTLSVVIAQCFDAVCVRSDVERKRLYGLSALERSQSELDGGIYSATATEKTFECLMGITRDVLGYGYNVIVDATFLSKIRRDAFRELADACKVPFVIINCQARESTMIDRLNSRTFIAVDTSEAAVDASEADVNVMMRQRDLQDPLSDEENIYTLTVDTEKAFIADEFSSFVEQQQALIN